MTRRFHKREFTMSEDELWFEWEQRNERNGEHKTLKDGILDPALFRKAAPRKTLFVMRESNRSFTNDHPDLRVEYYNKPWTVVRRLAQCVLDGPPIPRPGEISVDQANDAFKKIALINLKKASGGGGEANLSSINAYAHRDRDLLKEQLDLISPNFIVACGTNTFESLTWLMDLDVDPDNPSIWVRSRTGIFVLPIRHPSHDGHPEATYCRLGDLVTSCANNAPMERMHAVV